MLLTKLSSKLAFATMAAGFMLAVWTPARAQDKLKFFYVTHGSVQFPFFAKLKKGMDDACDLIQAKCQFVEIKNIGNVQEELTALERAIVQQPDGIAVSLIDDSVMDDAVQRAIDQGVPVVAFNADDTMGADGNARLSYIGQDIAQAGYEVTKALSEFFPAEGDVHVLIGVQDYAQTQFVKRSMGVKRFMDDYKAANRDRKVTWDEIETGVDAGTIANRVGAYVQSNPDTTAYVDTGFFHASAAIGLRDLGYKPGDILLAGFDMVQMVFDEMGTGYIQVSIDQQGYLQGFLPIMQLYLINKVGANAWDVDTGAVLFYPQDIDALEPLVQQGLR